MILVDTNVLVAATFRTDRHHRAAHDFLQEVTEQLVIPTTVIAETCFFLTKWGRATLAADFLRSFTAADGPELVELTAEDLTRMANLTEHYASLPLDAADASIIALSERLGISKIATFDRQDFTVVRPNHVEVFELLPD